MTRDLYLNGISQVKAYRILQNQVATVVRNHGLGSVSEWFVLNYVCHNEPAIAKDMAALLEVEAPLITRLVNNLSQRELVMIGAYPADKRFKAISATPKAQILVPAIQASLEKTLGTLLAGVSQADLVSYGRVLDSIIKNGEML